MKKALLKDSVKEIKNTYKRFISILLMAFLGVGFFAGIRATSPDMLDTVDKYYDNQDVYDIQVLSTLGLTDEDIEELSKVEGVEQVTGSFEKDGKIDIDNKEIVTKFLVIDDINKPLLLEGNLPQAENECLVENSFLKATNKQIGDTIQVEIEDSTNDDGEKKEYLKQKEIKIVGTAQSPLYVARDRGTSKLGAGKVNYYIYIQKDNINATDTYTNVYLTAKDAKQYVTSSDKYEDYIEVVKDNIEQIKEERQQARREQLVDSANQKVLDAENELNTKKEEASQQIAEAEAKLQDGRNKIQSGENEINSNKQKADREFAQASKQIENAKAQITTSEQELTSKENEANQKFAELENQKQDLQSNLEQINIAIPSIKEGYEYLLQILSNPDLSAEDKLKYEAQKQALEMKMTELEQSKASIENGISQIEAGISSGKQELENGKQQLEQAKAEITKNEQTLANTKNQTYAKFQTAKKEIENAKKELADGEEELAKNKQEFEEKIADAEKQLAESKEKIQEIENPTWYILDRNANAGYVGFIQDTKSIENIGKVFPVVFFIVATLISLTSMTRMVEEQRMQIGTLKALRLQ